MARHPHRVVKKTLRLDPDKLAQLQRLLQTTSASEAVRQAIDDTLAYSEALQAARRIQRRGTSGRYTMSVGGVRTSLTACTTIRKTLRHVPATGAHSRQGLSNMFDAPTTPEGVACSPLSGTTWLPHNASLSWPRKLTFLDDNRYDRFSHAS